MTIKKKRSKELDQFSNLLDAYDKAEKRRKELEALMVREASLSEKISQAAEYVWVLKMMKKLQKWKK